MMEINLIVCGIGGQGINGFAQRVQNAAIHNGWRTVGSIYKGGAQRLGSVHAEIRLFSPDVDVLVATKKSSHIRQGNLDVLLALEQWECLRYIGFCNENSFIVLDEFIEFPPGNRSNKESVLSPVNQLINNNITHDVRDFRIQSKLIQGNTRYVADIMWNHVMGQMKVEELIIKINNL